MTRHASTTRRSTPITTQPAKAGKPLPSLQKPAHPDLIWHIDDEGICDEAAPGICVPIFPPGKSSSASKVHDQLPTRAGHMLLSLIRKAIDAGAAQVGKLELTANGRTDSCQVQIVPQTKRGALTVPHEISENVHAENELRRSQARLRKLAQHLQTAREEERTRIAREIHDQMAQGLTALKIDLACLRAHLDSGSRGVEKDFANISTTVETMIAVVQNIAMELRPRVLDDFGLPSAVDWYVTKFSKRTGITCECSVPNHELKIENQAATALFRILQESLNNVLRHAHAQNISVSLEEHDHWISLEILDDGRGVEEVNTNHPFSLGIVGMQERARNLGGETVVTPRARGGTRVCAQIPIQAMRAPDNQQTSESTDKSTARPEHRN